MPIPEITTVLVAPDPTDVINFEQQALDYVNNQIELVEEINTAIQAINGLPSENVTSDITSYGFTLYSDTDAPERRYKLSLERNYGTSYVPQVKFSSVSLDGSTTYFDVQMATLDDLNLAIVTESTSAFDLNPSYARRYIRATYVGTKTMTIQPEATLPQSANAFYYVTNRAAGLLTITRGSGVTLNRPGQGGGYTTLQVQTGETIKITRVTTNNYDVEISPGNHGLGGFSIFQTGVSNDYTDQRGSGFIAFGSGYNAGIATTTSSSPVLHMEVSANGAAQFLSILPSSAGADNGKLGYRDRTGAVWSPTVEVQTSETTANVNGSPLYDQTQTVSGVTISVKIWKGKKAHCRDAMLICTVNGTASSSIVATFPDTNVTSGYQLTPYYTAGDSDYITAPIYTGVYGQPKVLAGNIDFIWSGGIKVVINNGAAFPDTFQTHMRYRTND